MISKILVDISTEFNENGITYHAYDKVPHERIDFIFRSEAIKAKSYYLIKDEYEGLPPSDHYPLYSEIKIK